MMQMSTGEAAARNKMNYLEAKSAFNRRDLDACMAFYAADHQMRSREVGPGREHIRAFLEQMHATWSNLQIVAEHVVARNVDLDDARLELDRHNRMDFGEA